MVAISCVGMLVCPSVPIVFTAHHATKVIVIGAVKASVLNRCNLTSDTHAQLLFVNSASLLTQPWPIWLQHFPAPAV